MFGCYLVSVVVEVLSWLIVACLGSSRPVILVIKV
jgi:hypothetical protein